jgi:hypothetical protein
MRLDFGGGWWRLAGSLLVVCMVGCGGGDEGKLESTSNDDIAAFIEQNPEFGAAQSTSSEKTELGLGE